MGKNAFLYGKYWSVEIVCEVKCVVVCLLFVGLCVVGAVCALY